MIKQLDILIDNNSDPMDDYEAGVIEGMRLARAEVLKWVDNSDYITRISRLYD